MGCFAYTCCLSGLPIDGGDEIKWFLLAQNPYDDNSVVCSPHDIWYVRSTPVSAVYNEYGSIEDYDPESPGVHAVVDCFKQDMVERGVGDNTCHDVPTTRGMNFEKVLDAVQERRVLIEREHDRKPFDEEEAAKGLPTLARVTKIIEGAGFKVNEQGFGAGDYLVDERGPGWVRVRISKFEETPPLEPLLELLQKEYAAMITAGSGRYTNRLEIQVMPLPGEKGEHRSFFREASDGNKTREVAQAMIKRDVWNALIKEGSYKKHLASARDEWERAVDHYQHEKDREELLRTTDNEEIKELLGNLSSLRSLMRFMNSIPFTMGPDNHLTAAAKRHVENPYTDEQIDQYLKDIAGYICVVSQIYKIRYWWRPSYSCGPQCGEYGNHKKWHTLLTKLSRRQRKSKITKG